MGRPPTKELKRPALNKLGRKKAEEEIDDDLEEIIAPGEDVVEGESGEDEEEEIEVEIEEEVKKPQLRFGPKSKFNARPRDDEEEEESKEEVKKPQLRYGPKSKFNARPRDEEADEAEDEEEEEVRKPAKKFVAKGKVKAPVRAAKDEDDEDDEDSSDESNDEDVEEESEEEFEEEKSGRPSGLTIGILVAIAGLFAAFYTLPILFFSNNPALGILVVVVVAGCVASYLRTAPEDRDSFFLSGPGLVTLGALLCLFLGGLSEMNKEKQRVADEAEAAAAEKVKHDAEVAAKAKEAEIAAQPTFTPREGGKSITHGKWTITQDDRGSYRVNGKKITGTWKLKDDQERIQFLTEEEKTEIRDALNKYDDLNQKPQ